MKLLLEQMCASYHAYESNPESTSAWTFGTLATSELQFSMDAEENDYQENVHICHRQS